MNLGEIKLAVQRQFGDTVEAQILESDIVQWANEAQMEIVRKTECLQEHRQTNMVASDGNYDLPDNFLFMKRVTVDDVVMISTSLDDLDKLSNTIDQNGPGIPRYYYMWNGVLVLYPTPSVAGSDDLDIWYIKAPATLVNDSDTPQIPIWMHLDIIRYSLARAKELDEDVTGAQAVYSDYQSRIAESQYELQAQPSTSYPAIRSLPGDTY